MIRTTKKELQSQTNNIIVWTKSFQELIKQEDALDDESQIEGMLSITNTITSFVNKIRSKLSSMLTKNVEFLPNSEATQLQRLEKMVNSLRRKNSSMERSLNASIQKQGDINSKLCNTIRVKDKEIELLKEKLEIQRSELLTYQKTAEHENHHKMRFFKNHGAYYEDGFIGEVIVKTAKCVYSQKAKKMAEAAESYSSGNNINSGSNNNPATGTESGEDDDYTDY